MKIALFQPNITSGKILENCGKLLSFCENAKRAECSLAIAPAEAITGIIHEICDRDLMNDCHQATDYLAKNLPADLGLLCSLPFNNFQTIYIENNFILHPGKEFNIKGQNFRIYSDLLPEKCNGEQYPWLIEQVSRPWHLSKKSCFDNLQKTAREKLAWIFKSSICGGYDNLVYSGPACVINPAGQICSTARLFQETMLVCDTNNPEIVEIMSLPPLENLWYALVTGVRDFFSKKGLSKAIIGLSGGMDSALVTCIAAEALGKENVYGILMPSAFTSQQSIDDARQLAKNLQIPVYTVPIQELVDSFALSLSQMFDIFTVRENDLTMENIQARTRGIILMAIANRSGALVLNTSNRSESSMGYCTLHGDTVGALAVIGDLYKTQVYQLASWYCQHNPGKEIPENIFIKAPSAELKPNQKDEDNMPPYPELDACLAKIFDGKDSVVASKSERMQEIREAVAKNKFKKRYYPPALLVGDYDSFI